MFAYVRAAYDYVYTLYAYYFCKTKEIIPFDAREKIYDRDPAVLNQILNYYRDEGVGKKLR